MSKQIIIKSIRSLSEREIISKDNCDLLEKVARKFSVALTPLTVRLSEKFPEIYSQYVPSVEELEVTPEELQDPTGDDVHSPVKGIVHRYPDRVLLKPLHHCAVYCRFCFRREQVGRNGEALNRNELEKAVNYIEKHPEIWEVILSGGDPLMMNPVKLQEIFNRLDSISHVKVIRIHSRVPIVNPVRITDSLLKVLREISKGLFLVLHCNSHLELTGEVREAVKKLNRSGVPLLSQSVLLRGVNDSAAQLELLFRELTSIRVKPYYLHHADLAEGTSHFRTSISDGREYMKELRGKVSGVCLPNYVLDIPGGYGKIPIGPVYLQESESGYSAEDWQGEIHSYKENLPES